MNGGSVQRSEIMNTNANAVGRITDLPHWMDGPLRITHASWREGTLFVSDQYGFRYRVLANGDWLSLDSDHEKIYASHLVEPMAQQ